MMTNLGDQTVGHSEHMTAFRKTVMDMKEHINRAVEVEVKAKRIPNRAHAKVLLNVKADDVNADDPIYEVLLRLDELFAPLVASIHWGWTQTDFPKWMFTHPDFPSIGVVVLMGEGVKCARCYRVSTQVGTHTDWDDLCDRCADVMRKLPLDHEFYQQEYFTKRRV
jgi:isoleucyl-tRNA synthetase